MKRISASGWFVRMENNKCIPNYIEQLFVRRGGGAIALILVVIRGFGEDIKKGKNELMERNKHFS